MTFRSLPKGGRLGWLQSLNQAFDPRGLPFFTTVWCSRLNTGGGSGCSLRRSPPPPKESAWIPGSVSFARAFSPRRGGFRTGRAICGTPHTAPGEALDVGLKTADFFHNLVEMLDGVARGIEQNSETALRFYLRYVE